MMAAPWQPLTSTGKYRVDDVLRLRERFEPAAYETLWSCDQDILAARDRVSRLLRYHCRWPNELLGPEDRIECISVNWALDGFDPAELVMELEDAFDIEIPEADQQWPPGMTYKALLRFLLGDKQVDFSKFDSDALVPFALPAGYHSEGLWHRITRRICRDRFRARMMRGQQACRSPALCQTLWQNDQQTIAARESLTAILVADLNWFDDAFVPDDRMDALLLADCDGRARSVRAAKRICSTLRLHGMRAETLPQNSMTVGSFLQLVH